MLASSSSSLLVVAMAKKKGKGSESPRQKPTDSSPAAPRITSNLKQNLQYLRLLKHYQSKSYAPKPPTSYRRKKAAKEEGSGDLESTDSLDEDEDSEISPPILLVDGYNVCGYWDKLKEHFSQGRLETARKMLTDHLITYSSIRETKVIVVFDALKSGFPSSMTSRGGVDVIFSADITADTWIEKEVAALREQGSSGVWVATSDILHQQSAFAAGASVWSCETLLKELKEADEEHQETLRRSRAAIQGTLFQHNLSPKVLGALKDLRSKLEEEKRKKIVLIFQSW